MAYKYLVTLDRARLRIYRFSQQPGQFTPSIQPVDAVDFPQSQNPYLSNDLDMAGRFSGFKGRTGGMPVDERSSMQEEAERSVIEQLTEHISDFLEKNPHSTWDLAVSSALRDKVVGALPESVRLSLDQIISKDLVNVPPAELREQFALS